MATFKKAERKQAYLKIALAGPSGSGKTFSALLLAKGLAEQMGSRVAVIDTENRSASLYADMRNGPLGGFEFDSCELEAPYSVKRYEEAIRAAADAGYKIIIVDSISHQWAGEGGVLDKKARMDISGGNSFANWQKLTPEQERFKSIILQSPVHLICTMRSKQEYVLEQNNQGKNEVRKKGMAPIQRDGMEYEFTTMFDIDMAHQAQVSKDRTGLFDGMLSVLGLDHAKMFYNWLMAAKPADLTPELHISCSAKGCAGAVRLHESRKGYVCTKSKSSKDGHTRFPVEDLEKALDAHRPHHQGDAAL